MPYDTLQKGCQVFAKYAELPAGSTDVQDARLGVKSFETVLGELRNAPSVEDLPAEFWVESFKSADRDYSGDIDIHEFVLWYSSNCFSEELMLPLGMMYDRCLCQTLDISILDMERYRRAFNKLNLDSSGYIVKVEFEKLLTKLLKVPRGQSLPTQRVATLWKQADIYGIGKIDFDEFVTFYVKNFNDRDGFANDPLQDFYNVRGFRRV